MKPYNKKDDRFEYRHSGTFNFGETPQGKAVGAAWRNDPETLYELLSTMENPNFSFENPIYPTSKITPLGMAASHNYLECMRRILNLSNIDVNAVDNYGRTPLMLAISYGCTSAAAMLIEREKVDVNKADNCGNTPLMMAAYLGLSDVVRTLIKFRSGDLLLETVNNGETALSCAYAQGNFVSAELIRRCLSTPGEEHGKRNTRFAQYTKTFFRKAKILCTEPPRPGP